MPAGAERATREQARLREIADGMDRAGRNNDDMAFMRLDRELNPLIVEAAHNEYAARAMRSLHGHSRRFWYLHYKRPPTCRCARGCTPPGPRHRRRRSPTRGQASDQLIDYVENFTRATVGP